MKARREAGTTREASVSGIRGDILMNLFLKETFEAWLVWWEGGGGRVERSFRCNARPYEWKLGKRSQSVGAPWSGLRSSSLVFLKGDAWVVIFFLCNSIPFNRCLCPGYVTRFHGIVTIEPSVLWERSWARYTKVCDSGERMSRARWLDVLVLDRGGDREGRVLRQMEGFGRRFGIACEIWTKTRIRTRVFLWFV